MSEQGKIRIRQLAEQFQPLTDAAWEELSALFSYVELKRGAYFVREGEYNDKLAFILDGALRAYYLDAKGDFYNKTFFIENTFAASLASILQDIPSFLNFDALVDTQMWQASYKQLTQLFDKHRCIERMVRKIIEYEWVIKKEQRELRLVLNDAAQRYAYFQEEYPGLENQIPQYHIASHLGITPIQLSRIRSQRKRNQKTKQ
ncbi:MAG: Crp/Fnr family transcriptional regulator [Saprospiraceae bacterium]|nr:Crp/Fnr family transcriptional regulator [Saprospiraceae bacterium]